MAEWAWNPMMKIGDKIVCVRIDDDLYEHKGLTLGKIYKFSNQGTPSGVIVTNDYGQNWAYSYHCFEKLSTNRKRKLKKINMWYDEN